MKRLALIALAAIALMACQNTHEEENYLLFLYDNMSLPDRLEMDTAYYRAQVATALTARAELPWGKDVPEREFRHFVLPPRVNNEDLDDFRQRYYPELRDRVRDLTMSEAILEVNHWCHEHVTYRPTSARTLGPVSTIRTAYGRCGEESVLLVAALRTVGIPARQVYTPRWAHTDDNHAWVEAWADGKWHFLGACEPEPILDLGWFNESASRGMLMHTRVFGNYDGPEEVVKHQYNLTEINVTDHYAPTTRLTVTVLDSLDSPVRDATVEFKLYNYAEFYTVASKTTDQQGRATLTAGHGTLLLWVTAPSHSSPSSPVGGLQGALAYRTVSLPTDSAVTLHLTSLTPHPSSLIPHPSSSLNLNISPPPASATLPVVPDSLRAENDRRLAIEDSIRHAYEATMPDQRSRGNHAVITAFLDSAAVLGQQDLAEQLITILPDKDLQDITLDVLLDNLPPQPSSLTPQPSPLSPQPSPLYLLSPRIERERLTPFKAPLRAALLPSLCAALLPSPTGEGLGERLFTWTRDSITVIDDQNPQQLRMTPLAVLRSRTADRLGRDIFFVAACRALGIPARINEIDGKVQYFDTVWNDVHFDHPLSPHPSTPGPQPSALSPQPQQKASLILTFHPTRFVPDAQYYTHFTLSRLDDDARMQLLTYPEEATAQNTFAAGVELDAGTYILTTGTRLADGSVLASMQSITLRPGITLRVPFTLREQAGTIAVIGSLNAEHLYLPLSPQPSSLPQPSSSPAGGSQGAPLSLLSTAGRGYYVLGLIAPNHEPTNHALRDIARVADGFNAWGRKVFLLFDSPASASRFNFSEFYPHPSAHTPHPSAHTPQPSSLSPQPSSSPAGGSQGAPSSLSPQPSAPFSLPSTVVWGSDIDGTIRNELIAQLHLPTSSLPIFVIADSFNRVVYVQQGYTIHLGDHLLKVIQQLK